MAETSSSGHQAAGADAGHASHSRRPYMVIFGLLFAFTVLEVLVALPSMGVSRSLKVSALILLALTKAGMVALWFMHLKSEFKVLRWSVLLPFAFPALYAFILIAEASWRLLG
ncbi:MAG TPA: cytochrome C oxidase subunit IV family protein [Myxococcales bacterium]|jgi:cytochrome c oxidase subunit 4|nr:cytochrome C oxidase subunit IV family protein [Myxococcales bacterium]